MILDKITDGRVSIKYFRELPKLDLIQRIVIGIPQLAGHTMTENSNAGLINSINTTFCGCTIGLEGDKGYLELRNTNLKTKTIERLIPCVLEKEVPT